MSSRTAGASGAPGVAHRDTEARAGRAATTTTTTRTKDVSTDRAHAPDGQHCDRCGGVHRPQLGCTFVTSRTWGAAEDRDDHDDDDDEQD
ncbi:hypothetical protein [Mycolicibacterium gilvum]|uniref:hypothetical protein n=1 Tax=Mycolicibacterium gilvum TaxID=1804 RepID=UPI0040466FC4